MPPHDFHRSFVRWIAARLDERERRLFLRMADRAEIEHRFSFLRPAHADATSIDLDGFYHADDFPGTARRMVRYEQEAPLLAEEAVAALDLGNALPRISHLILASCTGFTAPGIDQILIRRLGLSPAVERSVIGFMGCYAAVNALRLAHHIVRSEPEAQVLVINVELCTLHFQPMREMERLLSALLFGDGCSAALVSADPTGIALIDFRAMTLDDSADLIRWHIEDQGFTMHLSGAVPARLAHALPVGAGQILRGMAPDEIDHWAVHAGGRTILDAVEQGLRLGSAALRWSRAVLRDYGNMSSATLMFVLARMMRGAQPGLGVAMAFGPGMAAESFRFRLLADHGQD